MTLKDNVKIKVGKFIRSKRERVGLSQAEIAKRMGYGTPQFVSNWERGVSLPPVSSIKKLAALLDVSAEGLFELILEIEVLLAKEKFERKFRR